MTDNSYAGLTVFQAHGNRSTLSLSGNSQRNITGTVYSPDGSASLEQLSLTGESYVIGN